VIADYSLLYTWEGSDPKLPPVALLAHQDVVPVAPGTEGDWAAPPFDGVIRDGYVWGRGSWDDKGNLFAMLEAAELLAREGFRPRRTVYFAFGHGRGGVGQARRGGHRSAVQGPRRAPRLRARRGPADHRRHHQGRDQAGGADRHREKGYATLDMSAAATRATPRCRRARPRSAASAPPSRGSRAGPFPASIRGVMRQTLEAAAPEMDLVNRVVLSNLWLLEPLVRAQLEKAPQTAAAIRTTTAPTIFQAGDTENVLPGRAQRS